MKRQTSLFLCAEDPATLIAKSAGSVKNYRTVVSQLNTFALENSDVLQRYRLRRVQPTRYITCGIVNPSRTKAQMFSSQSNHSVQESCPFDRYITPTLELPYFDENIYFLNSKHKCS